MGQLWDDAPHPHDEWMDLGLLINGVPPTPRRRAERGPASSSSRHFLAQRGVAIQRALAWMKSRLDLDLYDEPDAFI